jgi:hypothetical protein
MCDKKAHVRLERRANLNLAKPMVVQLVGFALPYVKRETGGMDTGAYRVNRISRRNFYLFRLANLRDIARASRTRITRGQVKPARRIHGVKNGSNQ